MSDPSNADHQTPIINGMLRAISLTCFFVGTLGVLTFGWRYIRYPDVFGRIPIDPNVGTGISLLLLITAFTIPMVRDVNPDES